MLLADSANQAAYQAHFRAIFEELHGIPFNMVDLPLAGECQAIEAVLLLLALPLGEFTRPELLKVLTHPAVRRGFPRPMPTAGATGVWGWRSCMGPITTIMTEPISTAICSTGSKACGGWCWVRS